MDAPALEAAAHVFGKRRDRDVTVVRTRPQRLRDDGVEIAAQTTSQAVRRRRAPGGVLFEYLKRLAAIGNHRRHASSLVGRRIVAPRDDELSGTTRMMSGQQAIEQYPETVHIRSRRDERAAGLL